MRTWNKIMISLTFVKSFTHLIVPQYIMFHINSLLLGATNAGSTSKNIKQTWFFAFKKGSSTVKHRRSVYITRKWLWLFSGRFLYAQGYGKRYPVESLRYLSCPTCCNISTVRMVSTHFLAVRSVAANCCKVVEFLQLLNLLSILR